MAKYRFSDIEDESLQRLPPIRGFEKEELVSIQEAIKSLQEIVPDIKQMLHIVSDDIKLQHGLTVDEHLALRLYTLEWPKQNESVYTVLNKALRDPKRAASLPPWFQFLALILTGFSKLPKTDMCTVYCGVRLNLRDKYKPGKRIVWWGFSSCTTTIEALEDKFLGKTGPRTLFTVESDGGKEISYLSFYPDEKEILFTPGREFEIIGSIDMGSDLSMVQLKETKPEVPNIIDFPPIPNPTKIIVDSPKKVIKLSYTRKGINDDNLASILKETLEKQNCTELDLSENRITAKGAAIIAQALEKNRVSCFVLHVDFRQVDLF